VTATCQYQKKIVKMSSCFICSKVFKNVNSHIEKSHTRYEFQFRESKGEDDLGGTYFVARLYKVVNGVRSEIGVETSRCMQGCRYNPDYNFHAYQFKLDVDKEHYITLWVDVSDYTIRDARYEYYGKENRSVMLNIKRFSSVKI